MPSFMVFPWYLLVASPPGYWFCACLQVILQTGPASASHLPEVEKRGLCQKISRLACFQGFWTDPPRSFLLQRAHARRVLPVIPREQAIQLRIFPLERHGLDEQILAADREKLRRMVCGVRIDQRFAFKPAPAARRNGIDLGAEMVIGMIEDIVPGLGIERRVPASKERRMAVRLAIQHIDLVREFVDDDVVGVLA